MKEATVKQLAWRQRSRFLFRLKGAISAIQWRNIPLTDAEVKKLQESYDLISEVIRDFTESSRSLGFNAHERCYICRKPASIVYSPGKCLCERCSEELNKLNERKYTKNNE